MAITPKSPIEIPAATADKLWVTYLMVNAVTLTDPVRAFIRLAPYSSEDGVLYSQQSQEIDIPDLFAAASKDQTLANAIYVLFAAIEKLARDRYLFSDPPIISSISGKASISLE